MLPFLLFFFFLARKSNIHIQKFPQEEVARHFIAHQKEIIVYEILITAREKGGWMFLWHFICRVLWKLPLPWKALKMSLLWKGCTQNGYSLHGNLSCENLPKSSRNRSMPSETDSKFSLSWSVHSYLSCGHPIKQRFLDFLLLMRAWDGWELLRPTSHKMEGAGQSQPQNGSRWSGVWHNQLASPDITF